MSLQLSQAASDCTEALSYFSPQIKMQQITKVVWKCSPTPKKCENQDNKPIHKYDELKQLNVWKLCLIKHWK